MVKCAECGYLASRNIQSRILEETEQMARNEGWMAKIHEPPICFLQASDLWAESGIKHGIETEESYQFIKSTVQKERNCSQFTKWYQGSTPKEHREMTDREWMLKIEEERRRNDRKWHWIELIAIVIGTGLFTLLGAWIALGR